MERKKSRQFGILSGIFALGSVVGMSFLGRWIGSAWVDLRALLKRNGYGRGDEWKAMTSVQMQQNLATAAVSIVLALLAALISVWFLNMFIRMRNGTPMTAWAKRNRTLVLGYGAMGLAFCPFLGWGIYQLAYFIEMGTEYFGSWSEAVKSIIYYPYVATSLVLMVPAAVVFAIACVFVVIAVRNLSDPEARREKQEAAQRKKQAAYLAEGGLYAYGAQAAPPAETLNNLQQLKQMLDEGLITQQDYEAKKREFLEKM